MGLFDFLFKKKEIDLAYHNDGYFKTLTAYQPHFTTWGGELYESALVRSAIDARARHVSKLKVEIQGSARPTLQTKLRLKPNNWQTWSQFLYRTSTILDMHNTAFIVPVYDQGRPHMAALWGGSAPPPSLEANYQYLRSLDHFIEMCRKYHVDADLMNHPILNNGVERMAVMRNRLDQVANPFVIGEEGYIRFTGLYRQLAEDNIAAGVIDYTKG